MKTKLTVVALLLALLAAGAYSFLSRGTKLTDKDTVLIADFANATGDPVFDASLREALAVSLAQSPSLNLISEEKLAEALRAQGNLGGATFAKTASPAICQQVGATAYVHASIAEDNGKFVLRLNASRCPADKVIASARTEPQGKDQVVHALGEAVTELRRKFGEDPASIDKFDLPLERATSASLDALRAYSEGRRLAREKGAIEAVPAFQKAIELDPKFALAYSNLAVAYYNLNQNALAGPRIREAFELGDRQTERDRQHIATLYYDLGTGDINKAIESYKEWVRLYPHDYDAKGNLATDYLLTGDYQQAAGFAEQALRLNPGSSPWCENLATAQIALQRLDEAQDTLDQAFARKLDTPAMHTNLYALAFLRGDSAGMTREVAWSAGKPGAEDAMLASQADTEAYAGHLQKAREFSRRAVEAAQNAQLTEPAATWQGVAALREAVYGNNDEARRGAERVLQIAPDSRDAQMLATLIFARLGDPDRARRMTDNLIASYVANTIVQSTWLPTVRAQSELLNKSPAKALELLESVKPYERGQFLGGSCMIPVYLRGEAYLRAQLGPSAIDEFQKLIDDRGVVGNCWTGALALLGRARAQALAGSSASARASYQQFFTLWKDADPAIPILKAAQAEFSKLH